MFGRRIVKVQEISNRRFVAFERMWMLYFVVRKKFAYMMMERTA